MPLKLPKKLQSRREVDHEIKFEQGVKPLDLAPYHMMPPKLKNLHKKIIKEC